MIRVAEKASWRCLETLQLEGEDHRGGMSLCPASGLGGDPEDARAGRQLVLGREGLLWEAALS